MDSPKSLADKLKALGVKVGTADLFPPNRGDRGGFPIHTIVPGGYRQTARGEAFVSEQTFGADYRHGVQPLTILHPLETIATWARDPQISLFPLSSFAFLDTETSGMAGGTGTYAFMVGVGRFEGDDFRLAQFFLRDPSEEPAMLEALIEFLAPCKALVTFNGKAFDAPLLSTRYKLHEIPSPIKEFSHLDLLPLARRLWRDRLPSRALKYLEENILGLPRSAEEVPGYEIPWLYFDYLRTGDATPLKGVFYHNAMDVVAMAALLSHMAAMLHDPFNGNVQHGLDFIALGKLFEDMRQWDLAARLFEHGLAHELSEADFGAAVERLSHLQKRRGDINEAVRLWEQAAAQGHIYAHVELAKHFEHRVRDLDDALRWTKSALELAKESELPAYVKKHWKQELDHRLARLKTKNKSR
ncbi:MAG: ribonuclease H-like domain-containing protein [Chloroflexi bacterium]|nr:ribonuclease H-like domain-containing protein [Chloroflexota bacterium]